MSWNLFNRQAKRNLVPKTTERDFERECTKMQHLEDCSRKTAKDSKRLIGCLSNCGKSVEKLGHDLVTDLGENVHEDFNIFDSLMTKQNQLTQEKATMIHHSMAEPMKKYSTIFPHYQQQVKAREKALQEYNRVQAKLEKYEEREQTGSNIVKIQQTKHEIQPVKEDFERKNNSLLEEMPKFYEARIDYIHPSLRSTIATQCWFYQKSLEELDKTMSQLSCPINEQSDKNVTDILEELRMLSITNDD
uniref:BAR domain-containing protein n=1 Tax=Ciona savignyi TaxID=51511 RepID=H2Z6I4_CIOSA